MLFAVPFLILTQTGGIKTENKVDAPTLKYYHGSFVVTNGTKETTVPIAPKTASERNLFQFRRDNHYVVWDERGLTIRHGDKARTSQLEDVVTSPRIFAKDEIQQTIKEVEAGRRAKEAAAMSGAVRIGKDAYLLVRWEDMEHVSWAETLIRVPLEGEKLRPEVVGRFDGLSTAYKLVDDRLFIQGNKLAIVARQGKSWGMATYDPSSSKFDFRLMGGELLTYLLTSATSGFFVERTTYGTIVAAKADLALTDRRPYFEGHGNTRFLDAETPPFILSNAGDTTRLHNGITGAQVSIRSGSGVGRAGRYMVVWYPAASPTSATLYLTRTWQVMSTWKSGSGEKTAKPPLRSRKRERKSPARIQPFGAR